MNKKLELVKNTIIIFLGKICTQFISFFLLPLYTAYLNTSEYGTIDLIVTSVSFLVSLLTLQLEMAAFRFLIDSRNDEKKKDKIVYNSIKVMLISAFIFLLIFGVINFFIDIPYKFNILINVVSIMFSGLLLQIVRGLGKNNIYSVACIITGVSTLIFNILFIVILKVGAVGILISTNLANILCIIFITLILKLYKCIKFSNHDKKLIKELLKYSLPLIPNCITWWIINVSDRTLISIMLNVSANGIYALSTKFSHIISSLFAIFTMSWTESASLHINDKDRDEFFSDITDSVVRLISCLCIGIVAFMPFIFNIFVKEAYNEAYNYIPINILASFFSCIAEIFNSIYIAKKLTKNVANTTIISAIINILINVIFIKIIGIYAACISTVIAYFTMVIYRHFDLKKYVKLKYKPLTILSTSIVILLVYIIYYVNNIYLNIVNLIFVIIYSIIVNKNIFLSIILKLKKRKVFTQKKVKSY